MTHPESPPLLGPFKLIKPIGQGGMGQVWQAVHQAQRVAVAVKVITGRFARQPEYQRTFQYEVEAVARMNHPGITTIYDFGLVPESINAPGLTSGSPWFAMELATRGALDEMMPLTDWPTLRWILLEVLDALAHAHARGIVHRDLKPPNVLVTDEGSEHLKPKLTDFGVAIAMQTDGTLHTENLGVATAVGTPYYMAPEQFEGRWRAMGPWTDLYSLGCMAWELCTGKPPFSGNNVFELAIKHARDKVPQFRPFFTVPEGLHAWLHRLLEKSGEARFQRAADAAWALTLLDSGATVRPSGAVGVLSESGVAVTGLAHAPRATIEVLQSTVFGDWTVVDEGTLTDSYETSESQIGAARDGHGPSLSEQIKNDVPPLKPDWRRPVDRLRERPLSGVGLALVGLREVPFVGRLAERDTIWSALRQVQRTGRPRAVIIHGPPGSGKSRLAEWISRRVHESGSATVFRASHDPGLGPSHGLRRMLTNYLRCGGLEDDELHGRIRAALGRHYESDERLDLDVEQLGVLLGPEAAAEVRFSSERQRYQAVLRVWQLLASERPLFVWLDDVQWGAEALGLVLHVLNSTEICIPSLFVLTVNDDVIARRVLESEWLATLRERTGVDDVGLSDLPIADQGAMLQQIIRLTDELVDSVISRSSGKPMYASQLLGHLVETDGLRPTPAGFALRGAADQLLPRSIYDLWLSRVSDDGASVPRELQLAAALGNDVELREWQVAAKHAGFDPSWENVEPLVARGLIKRTENGFVFAHGEVRASVVQRAQEAGGWPALNHACAAMLEQLHPKPVAEVVERRAGFLIEAGAPRQAWEPLLLAATKWRNLGNYRRSSWLLDRHQNLLEQFSAPLEQQLAADALRAQLAEVQGDLQRALNISLSILETVNLGISPRVECDALLSAAQSALHLGKSDQASGWFQQVVEQPGVEHGRLIQAKLGLAQIARRKGRLDQARELVLFATKCAQAVDEPTLRISALSQLVLLLVADRDHQAALSSAHELLQESRRVCSWTGRITAYNSIGEVRRRAGDLEGAESAYREALELLEALDHSGRLAVRYNLGMLGLLRKNYPTAAVEFNQVLAAVDERHWIRTAVLAALLPVEADAGNWRSFDRYLDLVRVALGDETYVDHDMALVCELAGDEAGNRDESGRAADCYTLALSQWRQLGSDEHCRAVADKLSASHARG